MKIVINKQVTFMILAKEDQRGKPINIYDRTFGKVE